MYGQRIDSRSIIQAKVQAAVGAAEETAAGGYLADLPAAGRRKYYARADGVSIALGGPEAKAQPVFASGQIIAQ